MRSGTSPKVVCEEMGTSLPETCYARRGDINIAYQVVGEGERDLVLVSSWFSHLKAR